MFPLLILLKQAKKIPFASTPSTNFFENNRSAIENSEFVSDTIDCLLNTGRIVETDAPLYVVNPLPAQTQTLTSMYG